MNQARRNSGRLDKSHRLVPVALNGFKTFLIPAIAILFSYIVIQSSGKEVFGEFVPFLLYFHLANIVSNWGSKDFLLRSFSKEPRSKIRSWQTLFVARSPVLLVVIAGSFAFFPVDHALYISASIVLAYVSNSVQPMVNDQRDYSAVILIELLGFFVLLTLCLYFAPLDLAELLIVFTIYQAMRCLSYAIRFVRFFRFQSLVVEWKLLLVSFTFFLMAISGFLQGKVDLYIFESFATRIELADYQIISGFLMFSQGLATIILMPYVRNIYRMNNTALVKAKRLMVIIGIPIQLVSTAVIFLCLEWLFDFQADWIQTMLFFLIGYPSFTYAVHVFSAFAQGKEKQVLVVSLISAALNGVMSLILLSLNLGITGVLTAHALAQLIALIGYRSIRLNEFVPQEDQ
ncbi:MAG: hypothetical protein HWE22_05830 [Flavobacteriales bacterium]|nr:hypothetical protein [Flavobacteriales bacterium]